MVCHRMNLDPTTIDLGLGRAIIDPVPTTIDLGLGQTIIDPTTIDLGLGQAIIDPVFLIQL